MSLTLLLKEDTALGNDNGNVSVYIALALFVEE